MTVLKKVFRLKTWGDKLDLISDDIVLAAITIFPFFVLCQGTKKLTLFFLSHSNFCPHDQRVVGTFASTHTTVVGISLLA